MAADDFDDSDVTSPEVRPSAREVNEELRRVAAVRVQEFFEAAKSRVKGLRADVEKLLHEVDEIIGLIELLEPKKE